MKAGRFKLLLTAAVFAGAVAPLWLLGGAALANHDAIDRSDPAEFGEIGPLIMTHKDAISSVLVWTGENRDTPKVCLWLRNSQYPGSALVDPLLVSPDLGMTGGYRHDFGGDDRLDTHNQNIVGLVIRLRRSDGSEIR